MGATSRRRVVTWGAVLTAVLTAVLAALTVLAPSAAYAAERKVTICHRTNSPTNPYDQIAIAASSAVSGHAIHTGPVFEPGLQSWGDIIPPIPPELPRGLNWPAGRPLLTNGCETQPDVGPLPAATIGDVACTGANPGVDVTVSNDPDGTHPASFAIVVDGSVVQNVGPVAPGDSQTVTLGSDLAPLEDQTFTIEVRSGGEVIQSRVVTVDCDAGPPNVDLSAQLGCQGQTAQGALTATNNGNLPIEVTVMVNGTPVGTPVTVAPGATESGTADLSAYEDQTVTVEVLVDGDVYATYTATPDCVPPQTAPRVSVDGLVCPPPLVTVTLANDGDPDSSVVYGVRVDGRLVQQSAPIYGGDETTIVADLSAFEDRTVVVALTSNGEVLGRRAVHVNCERPAVGPDTAGTPSVPTVVPSGAAGPPPPGPGPGPVLLGSGLVLLLASWVTARRRHREPVRR